MSDAAHALLLVRTRSGLRAARGLATRPIAWLALTALLLSAHGGGFAGRGDAAAFLADHSQALDLAGAGILAAFAGLALAALASSPFRFSQADLAWLAAAPGGLPALLVAQTTSSTVIALCASSAWAVLVLMWGSLPAAAAVGTALTTVGLVAGIRGVSVAAHVAGSFGAVHDALRAWARAALVVAAAAAGWASIDDGAAAQALTPLRTVAEAVATGIWRPEIVPASAVLVAGVAVLSGAALAAVRQAPRLLEPAADTSASMQQLADAMGGEWSPAAMLAQGVRRGVSSWAPRWDLSGPRALCYRAACHERRLLRRTAGGAGAAAAASAAAAPLPQHAALYVVLVFAALAAAGELSGPMALEGWDGQLHAVPGNRVHQLVWLHVPRTATVLVTLWAAWLPAALLGSAPTSLAVAVAAVLPVVAAAIVAAGCVTALVGGPLMARAWRLMLLAGIPFALALTPVGAMGHLLSAWPLLGAVAAVFPGFVAVYLVFALSLLEAQDRPRIA